MALGDSREGRDAGRRSWFEELILMPETVSQEEQRGCGTVGTYCLLLFLLPVLYLVLITCLLQNLFYASPLLRSLPGFFPPLALGECLSACEDSIHFQIIYSAARVGMCFNPYWMLGTGPGPQGYIINAH